MTKTILALTTASALALSIAFAAETPAPADPFADWEVRTEAAFAKADANEDGTASAAESAAYWNGVSDELVAAGKPALTEAELAARAADFVKLAGEDQLATLAEVKAFRKAQIEAMKAEAAKASAAQ